MKILENDFSGSKKRLTEGKSKMKQDLSHDEVINSNNDDDGDDASEQRARSNFGSPSK